MVIKKLKKAIDDSGLTRAELAEKSKVKERTLNSWLYGKNPNPSVEDFLKAAAALGVSIEYLVTGKDGSMLTEDEILLLSIFRQMTKQRRRLLLRVARAVMDQPPE